MPKKDGMAMDNMHQGDAMSDPGQGSAMAFGLEPVEQAGDGRRVIGHRGRHGPILAADGETRAPADACDLPLEPRTAGERQIVEREFDAG